MDTLQKQCFLCGASEDIMRHLTTKICRNCSKLLSSRGGGLLTPSHHVAADHIIDHLYLGSERAAVDLDYLSKNAIGKVLVISESCRAYFESNAQLKYLVIKLPDEPESSLLDVLQQALEFMEPGEPATGSFGSNCLVHCVSGMSRSASLVIAYIMTKHGKSYDEAFALVKQKRAVICPNHGFIHQLKSLEARGGSQPSSLNAEPR